MKAVNVKSIAILVALIALILSSNISFTIPVSETGIPFTLQSLIVFVIAGLLSPKNFTATISLYLLLGIFGLPVFAEGTSGISKITGPSGGFLYGFLISGVFTSFYINKRGVKSLMQFQGIFLVATILLFTFGLGHLALKFGVLKSLEYGLFPFWKMALVKSVMAGFLVCYLKPIIKMED